LQDFVANHVHVNHPWFQEHPEWQTAYELPDGRKNLRLWNEHPFTTWFDTFIPSLDYEKYPEITQRQVEIANFWMDHAGIAGFRHDAVKHIPPMFWKSVTRELRKRPGYEFQIGETISDRLTIANFVGPDLLSGQFDFPLYFTLRGILGQGGGKMEDLAKSTLDSYTFYEPYSVMSPLLGNHDVSRFMAYADGDIPQGANEGEIGLKGTIQVDDPSNYRKLQLGFAYVFAVPGPPTLYYGDEIGMTGASDPDNRRPMVWENWTPEQTALQAAVGRLGRMRQANAALRRGELQVLSAGEEHIVLLRQTTDQAVIAAFFRKGSTAPVSLELPKGFANIRIESTPLETHGLTAQFGAAGGKATLNISGSDYSYGFWSVERAVR
ncbi:MAG: alpha-amylase family glycosyl hydrolase, partial [Candidatus Sumerlaeia bacterium]|nr:alpha-amylase family glycosyl hydrolase [Candidatus Sumerlaeia bacterium]